jgi:uncharacterized membrane protein
VDLGTRTHRQLLAVVGLILLVTLGGLAALWPSASDLPQTEAPEDLIAAVIVDVEEEERDTESFPGASGAFATVTLDVLEGPDEGRSIELDVNLDGYPPFTPGDRVALARSVVQDEVSYFITDFQRLPTLYLLIGLFVLVVLAVGRWHGLRSLLGLGISLFIIVRFVVPAILLGTSPPLVALVGALSVMIVTLYLAHGVNAMTTSAIIGTTAALVLTIALGSYFISAGSITGFASDDASLARFAVDGLDLRGLVLAGLIIAALGVLDDVTVAQASTVFAIHETDRTLPFPALFARSMKVGRDHIASVVNTLFLAYAGASLALLVLFSTSGLATSEIVNSEVFAEEVIKIVVGSIGLIAAVPFVTALAAAVALRSPPGSSGAHGHVHAHGAPTAGPTGVGEGRSVPDGAGGDDEDAADERAALAWDRYLRERGLTGEGDADLGRDDDGGASR